jgi:hypothetical protein
MSFRQRGIKFCIFDAHTATAYAGALDAVAARIMVAEADLPAARQLLAEARLMSGDV